MWSKDWSLLERPFELHPTSLRFLWILNFRLNALLVFFLFELQLSNLSPFCSNFSGIDLKKDILDCKMLDLRTLDLTREPASG